MKVSNNMKTATTITGVLLWTLFVKYLPTYSHIKLIPSLQSLCFKLMLEHCGKNSWFGRKSKISTRVELGTNSGGGDECQIFGKVIIGDCVMMGPKVVIYTVNHAHSKTSIPMIYQGIEDEKPVIIEDDVWIGHGVMIMPGVHIKKGAIIAAGAVVAKDIPSYCIAAGNPAHVVKVRKEN